MFTEWLIVSFAVLVAAMSPGPDFVVAVRNTLIGSRRAGLMTALGFGLGVCIHLAYCLAGLAVIISQSILLFSLFKYLGAAYLIYLGIGALRSKGMAQTFDADPADGPRNTLSDSQALRSGFLTNLLNPKATLFFLALFTQIIDPHTGMEARLLYGSTAALIVTLWFSFVALVLSSGPLRQRYLQCSCWIDRLCGGVLILLGLRLAAARAA